MIWVALFWVIFYAAHSILLLPAVQKGIQNSFRWKPKSFRVFYNLVSLILLFLALGAYKWSPRNSLTELPAFLNYFGIAMMLLSIWLAKRAFRSYNLPVFLGLKEEIQMPLSIEGMNRYVRHPLYSASLLLFWSGLLVFSNSSYLIICVVTTIYVHIGYRLEERRLLTYFGEEYQDYMRRVPALVPKLFSGN